MIGDGLGWEGGDNIKGRHLSDEMGDDKVSLYFVFSEGTMLKNKYIK